MTGLNANEILKYSSEEVYCTTLLDDQSLPWEFKTLLELQGDTQATLDAPRLYVPDNIADIAGHELLALEELTTPEFRRLEDFELDISAPRHITDVNSLLQVNQVSLRW